jgi:hypothetical protein
MAVSRDPRLEGEYRRGYADGFIQAVNQLQDLVDDDGLAFDDAHQRCFDHWQDVLVDWVKRSQRGDMELAPDVPRGRQW